MIAARLEAATGALKLLLRGLILTAIPVNRRAHERQVGRLGLCLAEPLVPREQCLELALCEVRARRDLGDLPRGVDAARRDVVRKRLLDVVLFLEPARRARVQFDKPLRVTLLESFLQEVPEKRVVDQPARHARQEQVLRLGGVQPGRAVGDAEHDRAQLRREAGQHGRLKQKMPQVRQLCLKHAARQRLEQRLRLGGGAEDAVAKARRQRLERQHNPRRPAVQPVDKPLHLLRRRLVAQQVAGKLGDLRLGQSQIFLPDSENLVTGDQLGEREGGQRAAQQKQVAGLRQAADHVL